MAPRASCLASILTFYSIVAVLRRLRLLLLLLLLLVINVRVRFWIRHFFHQGSCESGSAANTSVTNVTDATAATALMPGTPYCITTVIITTISLSTRWHALVPPGFC
jgi:hypothetical protein